MKLDQVEKDLLTEFGEEMINTPNCDSFLAELKSTLEKMVMNLNQNRRRVVGRYVPDCGVQLLGHMMQVQELMGQIQAFLNDQYNGKSMGHLQPNQSGLVSKAFSGLRLNETVADASYFLPWGLEVVVRQGDITVEQADVLVNAANGDLDHTGGVAAALSRAGGLSGTGGGCGNERPLLEKTVKTALCLAETLELQTLAMPCISSGIFGVPLKVCTEAIVSAVRDFGRVERILTEVTLIDVRAEVVRAMQEVCDRLIMGRMKPSESDEGSRTSNTTNASDGDTANVSTRGTAAPEACVQVEIVQGCIEKQQVDVLVSPMVEREPLSSRVGNVLFEEAGPELLAAFRRNSQGQIAPGDTVLVERLSGLMSSNVFFLSCTQWKYNPNGPAVKALRHGVRNILTSCDNKGFHSVAFPVVGTGVVLKFPHEVATRVLLEEIHKYEKRRANGSLSLIRIVVHPSDRDSTQALQTAQNALDLSNIKMLVCPMEDIRIVLLGKTGSGKSSSGCTFFGQDGVFHTDSSPTSTTQICDAQTRNINGRNITLIDTPGLFDTNISEEALKPKIVSCITECAPGPHAFVIVLKVERYTVHEKETVAKIEKYFSPEAFKYATVLFTHGEDLSGLTIEEFVEQNDELKTLVDKCGGAVTSSTTNTGTTVSGISTETTRTK
ncbi:hypothetical protein DPEC_G00095480 [Dallia pectoralis]|uniref:Uncharacterized protein n=1 Tax=Dallia pectoralis TaxID=75939 RepID=A0ACC2GVA7_DALPE|nr:hypothetical protein DPEC_G00095480 [Dallia pectoralis]